MFTQSVYTCPNCTTVGINTKILCPEHGGNVVVPRKTTTEKKKERN